MQIKATMRYHLTVARMAIIKKSTNYKCWRLYGEKGTLQVVWRNVDWYSHYGEQFGGSFKTKNKTSIWPCYLTSGHISGEKHDPKDTHTANFIAALHTTARTWKQPQCPLTEEWIKKMSYVYTMKYYSAKKKEWNNAIRSNMNGTRDCHTEWSQSDRRNIIWHPLDVESKKEIIRMNLFTKQTHRLREQTYGCQGNIRGKGYLGSLGWTCICCYI